MQHICTRFLSAQLPVIFFIACWLPCQVGQLVVAHAALPINVIDDQKAPTWLSLEKLPFNCDASSWHAMAVKWSILGPNVCTIVSTIYQRHREHWNPKRHKSDLFTREPITQPQHEIIKCVKLQSSRYREVVIVPEIHQCLFSRRLQPNARPVILLVSVKETPIVLQVGVGTDSLHTVAVLGEVTVKGPQQSLGQGFCQSDDM